MMKDRQFIVVGNGIAGLSAAHTIRRFDKEASIIIITEEPYPTYSPCIIHYYITGEIRRQELFVKEFKDYSRENIQLISSEKVIHLDPDVKKITLKSKSLHYDKLILATGSKPIIPLIKGIKKKGVFTLKTIEDGDKITSWEGNTAVIIGSGPIGIEASLALQRKGYYVYLIEILDRILPQIFDKYPSCIIEDALKKAGIDVGTQETVIEILGEEKVEGVFSDKRKINCDTVILATGMKPEKAFTEGILEQGELGGIKVNNMMGTSHKDIYACGDCIETMSLLNAQPMLSMLWHNARKQGEIAGCNAVGFLKTYPGSINITRIEVPGLEAVSIGSIGGKLSPGAEIIELKRSDKYLRIIILKEVIVGVQSINWGEGLGLFFSAILRREKVNKYKELISSKSPFLRQIKQFPFGRKPNWAISKTELRNKEDLYFGTF